MRITQVTKFKRVTSKPMFQEGYTCPSDYEKDGVAWIEPMTAKELDTEEKQEKAFNDPNYYVEEKFDGTRATLHFMGDHARVFSRRVSVKTGWFCENSDSVPHLRDINVPELTGTVIDGEMFINGRPFKDVASVLNCKWDKAVERQKELGKITLHAFDIVCHKGYSIEHLPLYSRKEILREVIETVNEHGFNFIEEVPYYKCGEKFQHEGQTFTAKTYYQHIVKNGGEGVILKDMAGQYHQKRSNEYLKIKKFITKDTVIVGFNPPTKEYKGKFPKPSKWPYWYDEEDNTNFYVESNFDWFNDKTYKDYHTIVPVSKHFFNEWIGTLLVGVVITDEEIAKLPEDKDFEFVTYENNGAKYTFLIVGEVGGFDEEFREEITNNKGKYLFSTVEILANDMFKETGKMRHPRFFRMREDKDPLTCSWSEHISK